MTKQGKIVLALIIGVIVVIGGLIFLMGRGAGQGDKFVSNTEIQNIEASPSAQIDLGNVSYGGGIISKSFEIKNTSNEAVKLRKITTSCMCTNANFDIGGKVSRFYGMEMNGDLNPLISYDLPAGQTATVNFRFDPAAHGPAGIGKFDRTITLFFDAGFKELKFYGEVVN